MARILLPVLFLILILSLPAQASSEGVKVLLDGKALDLEPPALLADGYVLVPVKPFLEALGGAVAGEGQGGDFIGRWRDKEVVISLDCGAPAGEGGHGEVYVPGLALVGSIYVPLHQLAEALGGNLTWDFASRTVFWDTEAPQNRPAAGEGEKVSINTAPLEKLQEVLGLEENLARAIVEHRESKGPFRKIEDLLQVPGIDERVFAALKDRVTVIYEERGMASWYGSQFKGRRTASGEIYKQDELTAAHPELPFGTYVRVYCPATGRETVVRINDRGPFVPGRIIDLSRGAADAIGLRPYGVAEVIIQVMGEQPD